MPSLNLPNYVKIKVFSGEMVRLIAQTKVTEQPLRIVQLTMIFYKGGLTIFWEIFTVIFHTPKHLKR